MLHVPITWPCARFACAFVQVVSPTAAAAAPHSRRDDGAVADAHTDVFLCRLVVAAVPTARFAFEATVRVPGAVATLLTQQDCTTVETHTVSLAHTRRGSDDDDDDDRHGLLYYVPCDGDSDDDDSGDDSATSPRWRLRLRCPRVLHVATVATLSGPRRHARATAAHVAAVLRGCYVCVGARVQTGDGAYTVASLAMAHGYGGVALVAASCAVKLNALRATTTTTTTAARRGDAAAADDDEAVVDATVARAPPRPVAVDDAVDALMRVLRMAQMRAGSVTGVLVRGPSGCGVTMLVRYCLHACAAHVDVLPWHSCGMAADDTAGSPLPLWSTSSAHRVVVLLVRPVERCFAAESPELAAVAMRRLRRDVAALVSRPLHSDKSVCHASSSNDDDEHSSSSSRCARRSVVVLAMTHHYATAAACEVLSGFFDVHIVLSMPDADQRTQMLASCRGRTHDDDDDSCRRLALTLVGKTSREVMTYARRAGRYAAASSSSTPHAAVPFRRVRWSDIGGLRDVKAQLHRALVWPQHEPAAFARFGLVPPKGVLLYGPPGCAKTTLVRALCCEGNFTFEYLDSATVVSAYVGESERYLRDVFARAAQQAPCIVFFDEVEVLGARRGDDGRDTTQTQLLSTLLTEMDGFASRAGVCFVGATNVPHLLDPALLRPGRFDYLVYVPLPSEADRAAILRLLLRHTAVDVDALARLTDGFSGADLRALCTTALLDLLAAPATRSGETVADDNDAAAAAAAALLRDTDAVTTALCDKARSFPRCQYDVAALEQFRREHGGDA